MKRILGNNRGNILVNTLLTLTLSVITISGISRTTAQAGTMQDEMLDRDLLVAFTDEVMDEYIPMVYQEFEDDLYRYTFYNNMGKDGDDFETDLNDLMSSIDYSKFLNCNASYVGGYTELRSYQVICSPTNSTEEYVVDFTVAADGAKEKHPLFGNSGWHYTYTISHKYYSRTIE